MALADYTTAIGYDPKYANNYIFRGSLYIELGQYELALTDLNTAISLDAKSTAAYFHRGVLFRKQQRYQDALDDFQRSQLSGPISPIVTKQITELKLLLE